MSSGGADARLESFEPDQTFTKDEIMNSRYDDGMLTLPRTVSFPSWATFVADNPARSALAGRLTFGTRWKLHRTSPNRWHIEWSPHTHEAYAVEQNPNPDKQTVLLFGQHPDAHAVAEALPDWAHVCGRKFSLQWAAYRLRVKRAAP